MRPPIPSAGHTFRLHQMANRHRRPVSVRTECVDFIPMSCNQCESGVLDDTGYANDQIIYMWEKYRFSIVRKARQLAGDNFDEFDDILYAVGVCLYVALWYIHQYPTVRTLGARTWGKFGRMTKTNFYRLVIPVLCATSLTIKEIFWEDRLHPRNHGVGIFSQRFTAFVDCAPIWVSRPKNKVLENALFSQKGKKGGAGHCYKMQLGVNFLGWIVMYTGLHLAKTGDTIIFNDTWEDHPLEDWEFWFGDAIYRVCDQVLAKFQRDDGALLSDYEVYMNNEVNDARQRVEMINAAVKEHAMFRQAFRGSHVLLRACVDLTIHMTNCKLRRTWESKDGIFRYKGFNYGPHNRRGV